MAPDQPAPIRKNVDQTPSALAQRSAALDALLALGCDYLTAARAVRDCVLAAAQS